MQIKIHGVIRRLFTDFPKILIAALLFALAEVMFIVPAGIIPGGVTGVANLLYFVTDGKIPIGATVIILNIPLLLLCLWKFGKLFVLKTAIGTVTSVALIDLLGREFFTKLFPPLQDEPLICAVFGGIAMGTSLGIYFSMGYTTGGADLLIMLLRRRFPRLSAGRISIALDAAIVAVAIVIIGILGDWDVSKAFYSAVVIFSAGVVMDRIIFGAGKSKMTVIVSSKSAEIAAKIAEELDRGITVLEGKGYYHGERREVLLCAIPPRQAFAMRALVYRIDPVAFVIFADASEVLGEGFKELGNRE